MASRAAADALHRLTTNCLTQVFFFHHPSPTWSDPCFSFRQKDLFFCHNHPCSEHSNCCMFPQDIYSRGHHSAVAKSSPGKSPLIGRFNHPGSAPTSPKAAITLIVRFQHPQIMPAEKRSSVSAATEPSKKRAPYIPRACETCRRRKVRCDGRKPCEYCIGRSFDCQYTPNLEDPRISAQGTINVQHNSKGSGWGQR